MRNNLQKTYKLNVMKRLLVTLTIALSFFTFSSFANDDTASSAALENFKNSFKNASDVTWTTFKDYYKAEFTLNGQSVAAYYNEEGQMIALTRNISSLQLPIALQASVKNNYENYWISDLFEMAGDQGTTYYLTLENADSKVVLKSSGNDWSVYQKQRK
jgi:hypothetical protein